MVKRLKGEICLRITDMAQIAAALAGAFLMGCIVSAILGKVTNENIWIPIGSIMVGICWVFMCGVIGISQMTLGFNLAVSMEKQRKEYYWQNAVLCLVECYLAGVLGLILTLLDTGIAGFLQVEKEIDMMVYYLKWMLPTGFLLMMAAGFVGAMILRFGNAAKTISIILFLFLCWTPTLWSDRLHAIVNLIPSAFIIPGIWILGIVCLLTGYVVNRKQQVIW